MTDTGWTGYTATRRALAIATLTTLLGACGGAEGPTTTPPPAVAMHEVRVTVAGDGRGNVRLAPSGLDCATGASSCASSMAAGTVATLTATPEAGSTFAGWTGTECGSAPTCALRVDGARTVTATFARVPTYTLGVATAGAGAGTVSSTPAGIACVRETGGRQAGACELSLVASTSVTLSAAPAAGSRFDGWSGAGAAGCVGTGVCTTVLYEARAVVATFSLIPVDLTIETAGAGTGDVTSTPGGVDCRRGADGATSGACVLSLAPGTSVTLVATPTAGSLFAGWSGSAAAGCSAAPTCTLSLSGAGTVRATFAARPVVPPVALSVALAGTGGGTVSGGGIACTRAAGGTATGACSVSLAPGTVVTLGAAASAGSTFAGWSGGGCGGTGACTTTVDLATTVTATFAPITFPVRVSIVGAGGGTVTSEPAGISCTRAAGAPEGAVSGTCTASFPPGTIVTLTRYTGVGSSLLRWEEACGGNEDCVIQTNGPRQVTARIVPTVPLTIVMGGNGSGNVSSSPSGIGCTRTATALQGLCTIPFALGSTVTLTAVAADRSAFGGWGGASGCTSLLNVCFVQMSGAREVTATFYLETKFLTVETAGGGDGTVVSSPAAIACRRQQFVESGPCTTSQPIGTPMTLQAIPAPGSAFVEWSIGCTGTGGCALSFDLSRRVVARFERLIPVPVGFSGAGAGSITSTPAGIACTRAVGGATSGTCSASFAAGSAVSLTATPAAGSLFTGWSGACYGTGTCITTPGAVQTATATFELPTTQVPLTLTLFGTGSGTVTWGASGASCTHTANPNGAVGVCTPTFPVGSSVTLTATATTPGSHFMSWGGSCVGTASTCTLSMSTARNVTVAFVYDVTAPVLTLTGVTDGASYVTHPAVAASASDNTSFTATPFRVTWSVRTTTGALLCAAPTTQPTFTAASGSVCPAIHVPYGYVGVPMATPAGTYTLTVQAVDFAGNASAPISRTYTVGM